jgi:hypothetical protein
MILAVTFTKDSPSEAVWDVSDAEWERPATLVNESKQGENR